MDNTPNCQLDVGGTIRANSLNQSAPNAGVGLEMYWTGTAAYIHPYDRTTPGYEGELNIRGTVVRIDAGAAAATTIYSGLDISSTGFVFNAGTIDMNYRIATDTYAYNFYIDGGDSSETNGGKTLIGRNTSATRNRKTLNVISNGSSTSITTGVGDTSSEGVFVYNANTGSGVYANIDFATNDGYDTTYNAMRMSWKGYTTSSTLGNYLSFIMYDGSMLEQFRFTRLGVFHAEDNIVSYSTTISSDKRLKENIETIEEDSLSKILSLRPVTFDWKDKKNEKKSSGYIAQEFEEFFPHLINEAVKLNDDTGTLYKHINYTALIPHITNAIKQQQEIINKQQQEINDLKEKLNIN